VAKRLKILWLSPGFPHPTNRGGQIRTLEILRWLHKRHDIHFLALHDGSTEAIRQSSEYCSRAWPVQFSLALKTSVRFRMQLMRGLVATEPVVVSRKHSSEMKHLAEELVRKEKYDRVVCDFLTSTTNLPSGTSFVLFQHNVETQIWLRYGNCARGVLRRWYFLRQAERMRIFERSACGRASRVVAVSKADANLLRELHGIEEVAVVPTGVDAAHFSKPSSYQTGSGLVFCGSMDWWPNIEGILWFVSEVLPAIHRLQPGCTLTIAGRNPSSAIYKLAADNPLIVVTGTVDDIRPYFWSSAVSIVPLHAGSGTRLKIFESMAAHIPVVSTTVGAEGLEVSSPQNIRIADSPENFALACLELLQDPVARESQASAAEQLVRERFSWQQAGSRFEEILYS
jgi:glycosyltransferase involved in cell wall biosynthesis